MHVCASRTSDLFLEAAEEIHDKVIDYTTNDQTECYNRQVTHADDMDC